MANTQKKNWRILKSINHQHLFDVRCLVYIWKMYTLYSCGYQPANQKTPHPERPGGNKRIYIHPELIEQQQNTSKG
jgi:hypothetical protein